MSRSGATTRSSASAAPPPSNSSDVPLSLEQGKERILKEVRRRY